MLKFPMRRWRGRLAAAVAMAGSVIGSSAHTALFVDDDNFVAFHLPPGAIADIGDEVVGGDATLSSRNGATGVWVLAEWPRRPRIIGRGAAAVITTTYRVDCPSGAVTRTQVDSWELTGFRLDSQIISEPSRTGDLGNVKN